MATPMTEERVEELAQKLADYYKVYEKTQQILNIGLATYTENFRGKFLEFCNACATLDSKKTITIETNDIKEKVEEKEEKPTTKKK